MPDQQTPASRKDSMMMTTKKRQNVPELIRYLVLLLLGYDFNLNTNKSKLINHYLQYNQSEVDNSDSEGNNNFHAENYDHQDLGQTDDDLMIFMKSLSQ